MTQPPDLPLDTASVGKVICIIGSLLMAIPMTVLPIAGADYNPLVFLSHLLMLCTCIFCWFRLRQQRMSGERCFWIIALGFTASNVLLLQLVGDFHDTIPTIILMVMTLVTPLSTGLTVTVCVLSILNLVIADFRFDFGFPPVLSLLVASALLALIALSEIVRRRREAAYRQVLVLAEQTARKEREIATREKRHQEQIARDDKFYSLGKLAGGVVHDINNLLTPIMGATDLLLDSKVDRNQSVLLSEVVQATEQISGLTAQLKAFAGSTDGEASVVDLAAEVEKISRLAWRGLDPHVTIATDFPPGQVFVRADASQLQQIVANLISNAVEACQQKPAGLINLSIRLQPEFVHLSVQDNGDGIPDVVRERMFEPFQSTKGIGRGLGLAAAYGAARQLGGDITADSSANGTRMTVSLRTAAPPSPIAVAQSNTPHGLTFLVVDDEPPVRRIIAQLLESLQGSVTQAGSGEAAVAHIKEGLRPTVVFMDIRMPGMDGVTAARKIRELAPDQPLIFCTGFSLEPLAGFEDDPLTGVISKPLNSDDLSRKIGEVIHPALEQPMVG